MLLTSVMAGADDRDPFSVSIGPCNPGAEPQACTRIGMSIDLGYGDPSEAAVRATRAAGAALADQGHVVVELDQGIADPYPILETLMAKRPAMRKGSSGYVRCSIPGTPGRSSLAGG